jgi:hypothetical protein
MEPQGPCDYPTGADLPNEVLMRLLPRLLLSSTAVAATLTCLPARADAEIYKWIDEKGRMHYSDQAPKPKVRLRSIEDRISLYTPERGVVEALRARASSEANTLSDRVADLERRLQNERLTRQASAEAAKQAAFERCLADRRTDCDQILSGGAGAPNPSLSGMPTAGSRPSPSRAT